MTLKAGDIRVPATAEQCRRVAIWLRYGYRLTALEVAAGNDTSARRARDLAQLLRRASRHPRIAINVSRATAQQLATLGWKSSSGWTVWLLRDVRVLASAAQAALQKHRGRPRRDPDRPVYRELDDRWKRRLSKRERIDGWYREQFATGRTVLDVATDPNRPDRPPPNF